MTYQEMETKLQELRDSAPIEYAFGINQENALLKKWGLTRSEKDLDKIADVGYGGYALKTDIPKIKQIYEQARQMEVDFYDNNPKEFAAKVEDNLRGYEDKADGIKLIYFTPNDKNKTIVKKQWKKICGDKYVYREQWIDNLFRELNDNN